MTYYIPDPYASLTQSMIKRKEDHYGTIKNTQKLIQDLTINTSNTINVNNLMDLTNPTMAFQTGQDLWKRLGRKELLTFSLSQLSRETGFHLGNILDHLEMIHVLPLKRIISFMANVLAHISQQNDVLELTYLSGIVAMITSAYNIEPISVVKCQSDTDVNATIARFKQGQKITALIIQFQLNVLVLYRTTDGFFYMQPLGSQKVVIPNFTLQSDYPDNCTSMNRLWHSIDVSLQNTLQSAHIDDDLRYVKFLLYYSFQHALLSGQPLTWLDLKTRVCLNSIHVLLKLLWTPQNHDETYTWTRNSATTSRLDPSIDYWWDYFEDDTLELPADNDETVPIDELKCDRIKTGQAVSKEEFVQMSLDDKRSQIARIFAKKDDEMLQPGFAKYFVRTLRAMKNQRNASLSVTDSGRSSLTNLRNTWDNSNLLLQYRFHMLLPNHDRCAFHNYCSYQLLHTLQHIISQDNYVTIHYTSDKMFQPTLVWLRQRIQSNKFDLIFDTQSAGGVTFRKPFAMSKYLAWLKNYYAIDNWFYDLRFLDTDKYYTIALDEIPFEPWICQYSDIQRVRRDLPYVTTLDLMMTLEERDQSRQVNEQKNQDYITLIQEIVSIANDPDLSDCYEGILDQFSSPTLVKSMYIRLGAHHYLSLLKKLHQNSTYQHDLDLSKIIDYQPSRPFDGFVPYHNDPTRKLYPNTCRFIPEPTFQIQEPAVALWYALGALIFHHMPSNIVTLLQDRDKTNLDDNGVFWYAQEYFPMHQVEKIQTISNLLHIVKPVSDASIQGNICFVPPSVPNVLFDASGQTILFARLDQNRFTTLNNNRYNTLQQERDWINQSYGVHTYDNAPRL